jgi:Holliday junction resolvase
MANRGTVKALSVDHENYIAQVFDGRRSPSSGASVTDPGDVKTEKYLIECKMTKAETKPVYLQQFEKIAQEAWEHSKEPMLALRFYQPDSPLADRNGWIDLVMMLASDMEAALDA